MDKINFEGIILKVQNMYSQQETTGYKVTIELPESPQSRKKAQNLMDFLNNACDFTVEKK